MQFRDERIMRFWAQRLNIDRHVLDEGGLFACFTPEAAHNLVVYTIGDKQIVVVPPHLQSRGQSGDQARTSTLDDLARQLQISLTLRYRDFIYYATTPIEPPVPFENARALTTADAPLLDALRAECTAAEIDLSEIGIDDITPVGHFDNGRLVGVASVLDHGSDIFDIGVLTHPAYRGRQIAVMLAAYLRNHITAQGKVAQYITMERNRASVRVAEKCGFARVVTEEGYAILDAQ